MIFNWQKLEKPFTALAPMDDVTDTVFRQIIAGCAKPDVMFTEFVNVEGLNSIGKNKLMSKLKFDKCERPIIAQIWGKIPENYYKVTQMIVKLGFDGVDINMGCPVKVVVKNGCGSAHIDNPKLAGEIIQAVREGVASTGNNIPVSVKTRIGTKRIVTEDWISFLLEQKLDAIIIHGRTQLEMSKVPVHWVEIGKAVKMRDKMKINTVIIGNGDVTTIKEVQKKAKEYGVDGVMIGRGIFNDMYIFSKKLKVYSKKEKINLLIKHLNIYKKTYGENGRFKVLKKYFKIYISGFDGASEIRTRLMETKNIEEARSVIKEID
ncbi:tRNA dihydrouridine synthase [Patescibacteria group bacterium]